MRKKRLRVTRLADIPPRKFGTLRTRSLALNGLLGDLSVVHERLPKRTTLPEIHHRRTAELVWCLKGSMAAVLNGRRRRVRAGDILLIPPGVRHRFITQASACEAISIFYPRLEIKPGADIHTT